jgi:O-methyltransferase involved in polyketide biosynthesis
MVVDGRLWLFGVEPEDVAEFVGQSGWYVVEHPTYQDLAERYVTPTG